jgi:hypothetical protein
MPDHALSRFMPSATATLVLAIGIAHAEISSPTTYSLLPVNVSGISRTLPGESHENRLSSERSLMLSPRFQWLTSTDLSRTRLDQPFPVRAQSLTLSTGPRIKIGDTELALPFNTGREASSLGSESSWSGGAPRMTVVLGPYDRIRLEAKISSRNQPLSNSRRRSTAISWRHKFNDRWSLTTGLRQERSSDMLESSINSTAETFASVDALLQGGWRGSLASSLSDSSYGTGTVNDAGRRDRSASLSLSTRYPLYGGWWVSGELRARQTWGEAETPLANQSGGLKLFRNF